MHSDTGAASIEVVRNALTGRKRRSLGDGFGLAVLLVTIYAVERFDVATRTVEQLRQSTLTPEEVAAAWPAGLTAAWALVLIGFLLAGWRVARRVVESAEEPSRWLALLAYGAVVVWGLWQLGGIFSLEGWWQRPRWISHTLYWGANGMAALALLRGGRNVVGRVDLDAASLVRVHLLFLAGLFLVVFRMPFTSPQMTDVLRGWGDGDNAARALAGIASALLLGAVVRGSSRRLLLPREDEQGAGRGLLEGGMGFSLPNVWQQVTGAAVALGLLIAAILLPAFNGLAFALAALVLVLVATVPQPPSATVPKEEREPLHRFAGTLGVVPLAILLVGLVGALTDSLLLSTGLTGSDRMLILWTAVVFVMFAALAGTTHLPLWEERSDDDPRWQAGAAAAVLSALTAYVPAVGAAGLLVLSLLLAFRFLGRRGRPELWAAWGTAAGLAAATIIEPVDAPRALGAFAVAMFGFAAIMASLHAIAYVALWRRTRFEVRGRRLTAPVVTLLALWLLVALLKAPVDVHRARTVERPAEPQTIEAAVREYLAVAPRVGTPPYTPMLIVGASGGGTKAAYWTGLVLDCAFGAGVPGERADECGGSAQAEVRRHALFLTSSVSGGSIGVHHLLEHFDRAGGDSDWVEPGAGREVLSPLIAWGIFHDLPNLMIGAPTDPNRCEQVRCPLNADRAFVQEVAIHGRLSDDSLLEGLLPVTVFNATAGTLGWRRLLLSRLSLARAPGCTQGGPVAGAMDGHDLLPDRDVPRATSALLSARFPLLLPPARLGTEIERATCSAPTHPDVHVRDGGLIENTGLMTIADLMPSILAAVHDWEEAEDADVRPIVLSIDDDVKIVQLDDEYERGVAGRVGLEDSGDNSDRARETIKAICDDEEFAYLEIRPQPRVGAQAATGWEISETSRRRDLVRSLRSGAPRHEVERLQQMLDGTLPPRAC